MDPDERPGAPEQVEPPICFDNSSEAVQGGIDSGSTVTAIRNPTNIAPSHHESNDMSRVVLGSPHSVDAHRARSCRLPLSMEKDLLERHTISDDKQLGGSANLAQKLLSFDSDGKLQSLKASCRGESDELATGSKITIIRYGGEDPSLRRIIGQRIDGICSGRSMIDLSGPKRSALGESKSSKALHPFFLPKPYHPSEASLHGEPPQSEGSIPEKMRRKHTIACTTPGKIRGIVNNARDEEWAGKFLPKVVLSKHIRKTHVALPGSKYPLWPPRNMVHVKETSIDDSDTSRSTKNPYMPTRRKLKTRQDRIEDVGSVMAQSMRLVCGYQAAFASNTDVNLKRNAKCRVPLRQIMTGHELRAKVQENFSRAKSTHAATTNLLDALSTSTSSFDNFECESQQWVCKYAPAQASHVLQIGPEPIILRDWLGKSSINRTESKIHNDARTGGVIEPMGRQDVTRLKRPVKRRKRELDDFIVNSDEELSQLDEVTVSDGLSSGYGREATGQQSLVRHHDPASSAPSTYRPTNAIVISGPHGCGKTAAVYAAAKELDFEVFEINAGSKRGGKEILERVGEMTRNHLVQQSEPVHGAEKSTFSRANGTPVLEGQEQPPLPQQEPIKSFFKCTATSKKSFESNAAASETYSKADNTGTQRAPNLKQSLVLIEEADVLFEDDKLFWSTVIELTLHSKRPVVMTCTNESLLPLDSLPLFAILRFAPPLDEMVSNYLLCMAAMEGHLLSRNAVEMLYKMKGRDLRASISELNLSCQMAIGDNKCGLDWRLIGPSSSENEHQATTVLRAISLDTYDVRRDNEVESEHTEVPRPSGALNLSEDASSTLWDECQIDVAEQFMLLASEAMDTCLSEDTRPNLTVLEDLDRHLDALSVADSYCPLGMRADNKTKMNLSLPKLTDSTSLHFTAEAPVLQAEPMIDITGLSNALSINLRNTAMNTLSQHYRATKNDQATFFQELLASKESQKHTATKAVQLLRSSLSPLNVPPKASLRPYAVSEIDHGSTNAIAEDVAPYVRSILHYDLRLAEQRHQLELSTSQSGGRSLRTRKTRASRAALEGGSKSSIRREVWFEASLDVKSVLSTGGTGWQEALHEILAADGREGNGDDVGENLGPAHSSAENAMQSESERDNEEF